MPRPAFVIPALTIAAALVASTAVAGAADAAPVTKHGRSAVNFHSTQNHHVVAPATTRPGIAHLRNTGRGIILIIEAKHPGTTRHDAAEALNASSPGRVSKDFRIIGVEYPGVGIYARLSSGTCYLADGVTNKIKASKIGVVAVSGKRIDATPPPSRGLLITSHKHVKLPATAPANGWLHLRDHSSSFSLLEVMPVAVGTTDGQLHALVAHPSEKKLTAAIHYRFDRPGFESVNFVVRHADFWAHYGDKAGRYVVVLTPISNHSGTGLSTLHRGQVRVLTLM